MKNNKIKAGDVFHIDTYRVNQYEEKRVVDNVTVITNPKKYSKKTLVHSPYLMANVFVFISDLKNI